MKLPGLDDLMFDGIKSLKIQSKTKLFSHISLSNSI